MTEDVPGYVLHQVVGLGANSRVHRAEPAGTPGRLVAVKRLHVRATPRDLDALRREAEALGRLSHPSILRLLDVVTTGDDEVALVFPYAPGGSLADRLGDVAGGLPAALVADVGARVAGALAAAHNAGFVHRDVKPANVLFDAEGQPLLADFGTAVLTGDAAPVAGTAEYVDPAVLAGHPPGARTDVYGLGVTLYEALAGVPPYAGSTPAQTLAAADRGRHVPLGEVTGAPADLVATIERAMHRDPDRRYATAVELAGHLDEARRRLDTGALVLPPPPPTAAAPAAAPPPDGTPATPPSPDEAPATPPSPSPSPPERSGTVTFGPAPPRPEPPTGGRRTLDRRLLVAAAAAAVLVPLAVVLWLLAGDRDPAAVGRTAPAPTSAGPEVERTAAVACDDQPRPTAAATGAARPDAPQVLLADVHGDGCSVPVRWTGTQLVVPGPDGREEARYDLAADPDDVLLFGDWTCDGHETPALYRPADGQLFVFDALRDDVTVRGQDTGVRDGAPVVLADGDGCDRVEVRR